jgi:hypothetical protein
MTGYDLNEPLDREDRRKHLDLIAAVINRMASASAQAKGWSIALAGAAFGVAVIRDNWLLILLGILGLTAFAKIDAHYLDVEKDFRDLHDAVVANTVTPLVMDTSEVSAGSRNASYASWSIKWFYGPLVFAGCLLLIYSLCHGRPVDQPPNEQTVKVTVTVAPTKTPQTANTPPAPTSSPSRVTDAPPAPSTTGATPSVEPPGQ